MRIQLLPACLLFLLSVPVNSEAQVIPDDSVRHAVDSVIEIETDPTTAFFQQHEKTKTPGKITLLLKSRKTVSLAAFFKQLNPGAPDEPLYADHAFADLDGDGRKELLISNFTGGAHCCDEIYIFRNTGLNKYQQAGKLFAGNTMITPENEFNYDFHEQYGYFFTCFACEYEDSTTAAPSPNSSIQLIYRNGKLQVKPGDAELKSLVQSNLSKLGGKAYQPLEDDIAQDNGLRKEIAFNLAVYYYSFGRNTAATEKLFFASYKHTDARKIWSQFLRQLNYMRQVNDF